MHTQDPINIAAVDWHTRREQGLDRDEEIEFQAWLTANPAHAQALTQLDDSLGLLRNLPAERVAHLHAVSKPENSLGHSVGSRPSQQRRTRHNQWRLAFPHHFAWWPQPVQASAIALCGVCVLITGIAWHQMMQPVFTSTYITARGQQFEVPLPDGSNLSLDADTRVEVSLFRHRREVRLMHGQAMFNVAADPAKQFDVLAGPARVTVVGTRFAVRYMTEGANPGSVDVAVEEGRVKVIDATGYLDSGLTELSSGQGIQVSHAGQPSPVSAISPNSVALWRQGLVRFTNTPLSDAIRELERYRPTHLVIQDPDVAALRIGGSFQIDHPDAFVRVLPQVLPVRLVSQPNGTTEIVKAL